MKSKIVMDSSGNLQQLMNTEFASVPLKIVTGEREFVDDSSTDIPEMVDYLKKYSGKTSSSCPAVGDYIDAFGDAENVYCITITSQLSGSCNAARIAAETYCGKHSGRKVHVIDSLSTGPEMMLLAEKLRELIEEKLPFEAITEKIREYQQKTHLLFSLESLHNLAANGRVPSVIAKAIGVLGIRLVGKASDEGTLQQTDKVRGEAKVIPAMIKNMLAAGYNGGKVRIDHCLNELAALELRRAILEKFPKANISIGTTGALCSFYAEHGGMLVGYES